MSSKERRHSSKDNSRKNKHNDDKDSNRKDNVERKEKKKVHVDKEMEIVRDKSDHRSKHHSSDKSRKERSDRTRDQTYESAFNEIKSAYKLDNNFEKERSKNRHDKSSDREERRHHKTDISRTEKLKTKTDSNEHREKSKHRTERNDEYSIKITNEDQRDYDKRRHRSDKGDVLDEKKKRRSEKEDGVQKSAESILNTEYGREKLKIKSDGDKDHLEKRKHYKEKIKEEYIPKDYVASSSKIQPELNQDTNYEDDFENYDDDFDAEDEELNQSPEVAEKTPSENSSTSNSSKKNNSPPLQQSKPNTQYNKIGQIHTSFINFKMAQKKYSHDLVANKMLARAYDLSRLIDMDRVDYDILEMTPVLEHGQYMRLFGKEGCHQEGTQTGDDNICRESQTEPIEERVVWTQNPPLDDEGCVQIISDYSELLTNRDRIQTRKTNSANILTESDIPRASLLQILWLIETVLEEEATFELTTNKSPSKNSKHSISDGYNKYSLIQGTYCTMARFAPANSNIFVTISEMITHEENQNKNNKTFSPISVWKVSGCSGEPLVTLTYPFTNDAKSDVTSVTFSPDATASHVLSGMNSGAIALWDLREYSLNKFSSKTLPPAYLTSGSNDDSERYHQGPIISIQTLRIGASSNSYQMISLDSFAQVFIWVVTTVSQSGQWTLASGSITDLNLRPGARYRLNIVASLSLASDITGIPSFFVTCMKIDPTSHSKLFIGTITGQIMQYTRLGHKAFNRRLCLQPKVLGGSDLFNSGAVTQLDYYPFDESFLLTGYNDGLIKIFDISKSLAVLSFCYKQNNPILQLQWSRSNPSIFFSLDVEGNLCVWNILVNVYQPVHVELLPGFIGFDLSSDSKWQIKDKVATKNKARIMLWALDGRLEVHDLSTEFSNPELDDNFRTCSLFRSLI